METTINEKSSVKYYYKELKKMPPLSSEEQNQLVIKAKKGDQEASDKLVKSNLRFVFSIAKQYSYVGISIEDLISEGNIGLIQAIEKFEPEQGFKFISYAVWWVRQSILQSLNENARTIRLPVNVVQELQKAKKELEKVGVDMPEKFANLPYTINLDNPLNDEGDTLVDILNNPNAELPDAGLSTEDTLKDKLIEMLDVLDEREKMIIQDYFGLSGSTRTLEDIGNDFTLTKERVRQIKEKALRKLRNETAILFEYL
jgi:RNA polymerase primary sigma factor